MFDKILILNADGFGLSNAENQAVLEGYVNGFLTSANICTNTDSFDSAVYNILPDCANLSLGINLNISQGTPLTNCNLLTNKHGNFDMSFMNIYLNKNNYSLLKQIEAEFRAQLEKAQKSGLRLYQISTLEHIHVIPEIFELVCKLAKEYNIDYVRTHDEELYFVPKIFKHLNFQYMKNLINVGKFKSFTNKNKQTAYKYDLKTNNCIIGIGYNKMMDIETVEQGLQMIEENGITEIVIHPKKYQNIKNLHSKEFAITQNMTLKDSITRLGFEITNYKKLYEWKNF